MDSTGESTIPPKNDEERVDPEEGIDAIVPEEREFLTQNRGAPLTQKNTAQKYLFKILLFISPYIVGVLFSIFLALFSCYVLYAPAISVLNALPPNATIKFDLELIKYNRSMYCGDGEVVFGKKLPNYYNYLFNNIAQTTPSCDIEFHLCDATSFDTSYLSNITIEECLYYLNGVDGGFLNFTKISPFPQYYTETEFLGFPFNRSEMAQNNNYPPCTFQPPNDQTTPGINASTSGLYLFEPGKSVSIPIHHLNHSNCINSSSGKKIPHNHSLFIKTTNNPSNQFCFMYIQCQDLKKTDKIVACFFGSLIYTFICLIACDIAKFLYSFFFKKKTE